MKRNSIYCFRKISVLLLLLLTFVSNQRSYAQCNTNTSVCDLSTSPTFNFVTPGSQVSTCLDFFGPNVGYIILYITTSGQLNMLINGNASSGFIDVAVFNIPDGQNPCTAIQNSANQLQCNYASSSSGCAQFGTQFPCPASISAPNVTAGQTLMIVVENWSGTSNSFTIQLANSANSAQTGAPTPVITPPGSFCSTASPAQLVTDTPGGTWSGPGMSASGMFNPATAGIGTHTVTYSIGTPPCQGIATTTVTVNPQGVIDVTPSTTICPGGNVQLTASGASTYTWTPSTGLSATTGATVTASPGSTTTYTVTGTSNGCTGTGSTTVTIGANPSVTASSNGPLCLGEDFELNASSSPGATYSWTGPNGFTSNEQNPTIPAIDNSHVGTYTVTLNLNGCTNTSSTNLVINPTITPVLTAQGPLCNSDNAINLITDVPGGIWSGTGIINPNTGVFSPSAAQIGNNVITYQLTIPCGGSASTTIVVNPQPIIDISVTPTSGCSPLEVVFQDATVPSSQQINWDFGDGTTSTQLGSASHTYFDPGCYDVRVTSTANGCVNERIFSDIVCVIPDPIAEFTTPNFSTNMFFPSFNFTNTSFGATSYEWDFGNGETSTLLNPSVTYTEEPNQYVVTLIATNDGGCKDTVYQVVIVEEELIFYVPNTFTPDGNEYNNSFHPVMTSGFDPFNFKLTVFNRWGEKVFETNDHKVGWDGTYNGIIVQNGTYTWTISFRDIKTDKKFEYAGHIQVMR